MILIEYVIMAKQFCRGFYKEQEPELLNRNPVTGSQDKFLFWFLNSVCCILFFAGCAADKPIREDIKSLSWETYLSNNQRNGQTLDSIRLPAESYSDLRLASSTIFKIFLPFDSEEYSSPAIFDNIVYIGSADKYFYAFDLEKESIVWKFKTSAPIESSPTVHDGRVYFGTGDGILYCLDTKEGREVWRFQAKTEIISSPLAEDGRIYFNSADDKLYALNSENGEKLWEYSRHYVKKITNRSFTSPALYGDRIIYNYSDGYVVAVEKHSGREVWQKRAIEEGGEVRGARFTPTIDDGNVYIINDSGFIIALNAENGEEIWKFNVLKISGFTMNRGYLFAVGYDGSVLALSKSGEIVWRKNVSQGVPVSIISAGSYLVVSSNYKTETFFSTDIGSYIDVFDMDKGRKIWNESIDSTTSSSLALAYNHLFIVTDKGYLRIFKSKSQD